jgi:hypothetical protein
MCGVTESVYGPRALAVRARWLLLLAKKTRSSKTSVGCKRQWETKSWRWSSDGLFLLFSVFFCFFFCYERSTGNRGLGELWV